MFDLAWSEIALIGVVALVVIGPKDLPEAIRGIAQGIGKLRKMAGEFQSQADELVREANLTEVRDTISQIRNFNIKGEIEKAVDGDGALRSAFKDDPLKDTPATPPKPVVEAPDFIPPAYAPNPPASVLPPIPEPPTVAAPDFVPPAEAGMGAPPPVTNADFAAPPSPPAEPAPAIKT
jgi:sec-independent protein translocase protein TatB